MGLILSRRLLEKGDRVRAQVRIRDLWKKWGGEAGWRRTLRYVNEKADRNGNIESDIRASLCEAEWKSRVIVLETIWSPLAHQTRTIERCHPPPKFDILPHLLRSRSSILRVESPEFPALKAMTVLKGKL